MTDQNDILSDLIINIYCPSNFNLLSESDLNNFTAVYEESLLGIAKGALKQKGKNNFTEEELRIQIQESREDFNRFWVEFLTEEINEDKFVVVAQINFEKVSIARFIRNKFTEGNWLVEAVETHPRFRRLGLSKSVLQKGIDFISKLNGECLAANIYNLNNKSMALHEALGFIATNKKPFDSYGDYDCEDIRYELIIGKVEEI